MAVYANEESNTQALFSYNPDLFENMAIFVDVVMEFDVENGSVLFLHDKLFHLDYTGHRISTDELSPHIKDVVYADDLLNVEKRLRISYMQSMTSSEVFNVRCLVDGEYHYIKCTMTPINKDGGVPVVYITAKDIQDIVAEKPLLDANENRAVVSFQKKVQKTLSLAKIGLWSIIIGDGDPKFIIDQVTASLVGVNYSVTPEEAYSFWYSCIDDDYKDDVQAVVQRILNGASGEVIYPYHHPLWGTIKIRCGGSLDTDYEGSGTCISGYHQNITDYNSELLEQMELGRSFAKVYTASILIDMETGKFRDLKSNSFMNNLYERYNHDFSSFVKAGSKHVRHDAKEFLDFFELETLQERLASRGFISYEFDGEVIGWVRAVFTPVKNDRGGKLKKALCLLQNISEEKRRNQILEQQARENLSVINDLSGAGMWYMDFDYNGNMTKVTRTDDFRKLLGYNSETEFPDTLDSWLSSLHPDDKDRVQKAFFEGMYSDKDYKEKYRLRKKNGTYDLFESHGRCARYDNGNPRLYIGTLTNITMQESETRDINEKLETVIAGISGGFIVGNNDYDYSIKYLSESVAAIQGYTVSEFMEKCQGSMRVNCYEMDRARVAKEIAEHYLEGESYSVKYRVVHKDGSFRWLHDSGKRVTMPSGEILHYSLIQDVTKEETANIRLLDEQNMFRSALTKNAITYFTVDITYGVIIKDNMAPSSEKIFSDLGIELPYSYDEDCKGFIRDNGVQFFNKRSELFFSTAGIRQMFEEGVTSEAAVYYDSKRDRYFEVHILLSKDTVDSHIKAIVIYRDVTKEKKSELYQQRLLRESIAATAKANAAKTEFLSTMSHDIRTPMNAIVGMTAIAANHIDEKERVKDCLSKITTSSKHLLNLINEVLDMSKIESGKMNLQEEPFDLTQLIDSLMGMTKVLLVQKKHKFMVNTSGLRHEKVIGDSMRIQQVFMNLVGNAIKYTPDGGVIKLSIKEKDCDKRGVGYYEWTIEDNGIGMSEEFQKMLFTPFAREEDSRTSKIQGTGLGMAIAKNIVTMMNGDIKVESRQNEGTKFIVTFYLKIQDNEEMVCPAEFKDLNVLVVDNDSFAISTACDLILDLGMKLDVVLSGEKAIEKIAKNHDEGNDYFAVIIDSQLQGMDGIETARRIRTDISSEQPFIVLSAYDWTEIEQKARNAGVARFISKPLFKSRVIQLFSNLLGIAENEKNKDNPLKPFEEADFSGRRALLVEDNEINAEIAKEILGMTGLEVDFAENGKKAFEKVSSAQAGYYDIIFMDVQMPVMNGYEATKAIRSLDGDYPKNVPIIAMTANAFSEDVKNALDAGMDEHISKPLNVGVLMESLRRWLR